MSENTSVEVSATAGIEIKGKIRRGEYRVDERAVADAILRRRRERAAVRAERMATATRPLAETGQSNGSTADVHDR